METAPNQEKALAGVFSQLWKPMDRLQDIDRNCQDLKPSLG